MSVSESNVYEQALAQAISALGTAAFARRLAELVNGQVASDCCVMLSYRSPGSAVYLYDNLAERRELLFGPYLNGIYTLDPFYRALCQGLPDGVYSLAAVMQQLGVRDPDYLAGFYQATGWQHELGLVLALHEGQWLTLCLGRLAPTPFSPAEQNRLRHLLPILRALCRQHWPAGAGVLAQTPVSPTADFPRPMRDRIERALARFGQSRLTPREQQVAVALLQGQDNATIAQALGIGEGTVKNHRKHVYRKLAIDSQAALFTQFINHLITDNAV